MKRDSTIRVLSYSPWQTLSESLLKNFFNILL